MSKVLCLDCYSIYDKERIVFDNYSDFNFCPNVNCNGQLIEVDDLILPTIEILNNKCYFTQYCCSGHYGEDISSIYIKFCEECFEDVANSKLPKGFIVEDGYTIRYSPNENSNPYIKFERIMKKNIELLKWATSLPHTEY